MDKSLEDHGASEVLDDCFIHGSTRQSARIVHCNESADNPEIRGDVFPDDLDGLVELPDALESENVFCANRHNDIISNDQGIVDVYPTDCRGTVNDDEIKEIPGSANVRLQVRI
jgi:hypothetical protein